jgi:hypothetical protein
LSAEKWEKGMTYALQIADAVETMPVQLEAAEDSLMLDACEPAGDIDEELLDSLLQMTRRHSDVLSSVISIVRSALRFACSAVAPMPRMWCRTPC